MVVVKRGRKVKEIAFGIGIANVKGWQTPYCIHTEIKKPHRNIGLSVCVSWKIIKKRNMCIVCSNGLDAKVAISMKISLCFFYFMKSDERTEDSVG